MSMIEVMNRIKATIHCYYSRDDDTYVISFDGIRSNVGKKILISMYAYFHEFLNGVPKDKKVTFQYGSPFVVITMQQWFFDDTNTLITIDTVGKVVDIVVDKDDYKKIVKMIDKVLKEDHSKQFNCFFTDPITDKDREMNEIKFGTKDRYDTSSGLPKYYVGEID